MNQGVTAKDGETISHLWFRAYVLGYFFFTQALRRAYVETGQTFGQRKGKMERDPERAERKRGQF